MRNSARKQTLNRSNSTGCTPFEKKFLAELPAAGNKAEATKALHAATSALDKAAKTGTIPKSRADRKKSRLRYFWNKPA